MNELASNMTTRSFPTARVAVTAVVMDMNPDFSVKAVCISEKKGTVKHPVPEIYVKINYGVCGDAHAGNWHRQVSLLADESVDTMRLRLPDIPVGLLRKTS